MAAVSAMFCVVVGYTWVFQKLADPLDATRLHLEQFPGSSSQDKAALPIYAFATRPLVPSRSQNDHGRQPPLVSNPQTKQRLGFDEVYVINLPHRVDRYQTMLLLTDFLGVTARFTRAVTPDTMGHIPPYSRRAPTMSPHRLACWRSHMNVYAEIVRQNHTQALILEDDVDFDLGLPHEGPQMLAALPSNWDIFFLGHCSLTEGQGALVNLALGLYVADAPFCAHGYAVSHKGARKLLHLLSTAATALDFHLIGLIRAGWVKAYSANPPRIIQPRDPTNPSDIPESTQLPPNQVLRRSARKALHVWAHQEGPIEAHRL
ncbi:hypothetical protein H4R34_000204 [Dimargaris verticillata]|uniref:Glycosyl transferase family 25 domain-containing protein n=1 Tax=Dimargaris verticillata TaxID=2761393 RepID=A0A9W8BCA1_9FUNG|nr:hypothetical protein H4R34_000204 [Dimargaris verticillata]